MKRVWLYIIMFGLGLPQVSMGQDAGQILQEFQQKFESVTDISGNFIYSISNYSLRSASAKKNGSFILKKGDKFLVKLDGQEIYCDGKTQWIHLVDDKEVTKMSYEPDEGVNIEQVFNLYKSSSEARYDGTEKVQNVCHKIYLSFADKNLEYNQALLWINTKTKILEKAVTIDRRQTKTTYEFSNVKTNTGFADSTFMFDTSSHPDVEVWDETRD